MLAFQAFLGFCRLQRRPRLPNAGFNVKIEIYYADFKCEDQNL